MDDDYSIETAIWQRDIDSIVARVSAGDEYVMDLFDQWSPAEWRDLAAELARYKLRAVQADGPGMVLIIESDADGCPSITVIGPRDDQATGSRFVEDVCADCEADGSEVKLLTQRIDRSATRFLVGMALTPDSAILLCAACQRRRAKCEQAHAAIRCGMVPAEARFVGLQEQGGGLFPLRLFACHWCGTTVAYETRGDDREIMDAETGTARP